MIYLGKKKKKKDISFSGGPVAKTPYSKGSRLRFNPWPGNLSTNTTEVHMLQ